ncbi:hypothetical protein WA158_008324 [Blastocystis sp. Blastoise]
MNMMLKVFTVAILFISVAFGSNLRDMLVIPIVTNCGNKDYSVFFYNMEITEVERGKELILITNQGKSTREFYNGTIQVTATASGTAVLTGYAGICGYQEIKMPFGLGKIEIINPSCPIESNMYPSITMKTRLPIITPPGYYSFKLDATDGNNNKLFCINVSFKL